MPTRSVFCRFGLCKIQQDRGGRLFLLSCGASRQAQGRRQGAEGRAGHRHGPHPRVQWVVKQVRPRSHRSNDPARCCLRVAARENAPSDIPTPSYTLFKPPSACPNSALQLSSAPPPMFGPHLSTFANAPSDVRTTIFTLSQPGFGCSKGGLQLCSRAVRMSGQASHKYQTSRWNIRWPVSMVFRAHRTTQDCGALDTLLLAAVPLLPIFRAFAWPRTCVLSRHALARCHSHGAVHGLCRSRLSCPRRVSLGIPPQPPSPWRW